jgi:exosortase B
MSGLTVLERGPGAGAFVLVVAAWLVLALPTLWDFLFGPWVGYSQGHELLLLSVVLWLFWRRLPALMALPSAPMGLAGWLFLGAACLAYVFGRTQEFIRVELIALWWVSLSLMLITKGRAALRQTWFIWLFALFIIPLPYSVLLTVTGPLKEAVSAVATFILKTVGYPVGRTGVIMTVGQYQLLVAEACAGLHSMFILESMCLLYSYLANHTSWWRNATLAALAVPVSFAANVVRVMVLTLVTYHFGDEAGQGFVHGFAGIVLFVAALALIGLVDVVLGLIWPDGPRVPGQGGAHG